jgi:hypothetical protein
MVPLVGIYEYQLASSQQTLVTGASSCADLAGVAPVHSFMPLGGNSLLVCSTQRLPIDPQRDTVVSRSRYALQRHHMSDGSVSDLAVFESNTGSLPWIRAIVGDDERVYLQFSKTLPDLPEALSFDFDSVNPADTIILSRSPGESVWTALTLRQAELPSAPSSVPGGYGQNQLMAVDAQSSLYFYAASSGQLTQVNRAGELVWQISADDVGVDAFILLDVTANRTLLLQTRRSPAQPFTTVQECSVTP